jgi:hypothetical protein
MELTVAIIISIINVVISVSSFVLVRKDKAVDNTKKETLELGEESSNQKLIEYRLTQVEKKLDKILDVLENYDKEIDTRINKALEQHISFYHKGVQ